MADENTAGEEGVAPQDLGGTQRVTVAPDAEAQAKANLGTQQQEADPNARPEGLPEGFDSWEAYGKHAAEEAAKAAQAKEEGTTGEEGTGTQEGAPEADDPRLAPYTAELTEKGTLSEESVGKAAAEFLGEDTPANRAIVQNYVDMMTNQASMATAPIIGEFHELAGGAEFYSEWGKWAEGGGISPEKLASYNKALDNDPVAAKELLKAYVAEWRATGAGKPARDITGEGGGQGNQAAGDKYASWAQVTVDMNDSRYTGVGGKKDPAFIKSVEEKLGRSGNL